MNILDSLVPPNLKARAVQLGDEFVYPYPDVLDVIGIANQNRISILGSEFFRIQADGLATMAISGYEIRFSGEWDAFVRENNELAVTFAEQNRKGGKYGFVLTSTSADEFKQLGQQI